MSLTYHIALSGYSSFASDSIATTKSKLNSNLLVSALNEGDIEARFENSLDDILGKFILSGMIPTLNAGALSFAVTSGAALIGARVACAAANVPVSANQTDQPIYFTQTSLWDTAGAAPSGVSYLQYGIYTSDGTEITSLTLQANYVTIPGGLKLSKTDKIIVATANGYSNSIRLYPAYSADSALAVTEHHYIEMNDATLATATLTGATILKLDTALGTHKATTNTDKTGNAKSGTLRISVNNVIYHIQLYANA